MKQIITEYAYRENNIVEKNTIIQTINEFDTALAIRNLFTEKGQFLISSAAGVMGVLGPGLDGQVPVWDSASTYGMKAGTPASGAGETLTNHAGTTLNAGAVVILNGDYDGSVETTTLEADPRVHAIASEDIADGEDGGFITKAARASVLVTGAIGRYEFLVTSTAAGRLKGAGYRRPIRGCVGIALEANPSGNASIDASVDVDMFMSYSEGTCFLQGNYAASTLSQSFSAVTEVTSGATALPGNKTSSGTMTSNTDSYLLGGGTATTYKTPFSTGTPAACASANLPITTHYQMQSGPGTSSKGFLFGGYQGGSIATCYKQDYSTETISVVATAALTAAKYAVGALNDTNAAYTFGGYTAVATAHKMPYSTETTAAVSGANLSAARASVQTISNPGSKGYIAGGFTGTPSAVVDKCTFSSDTTAASTGIGTARGTGGGAGFTGNGYVLGGGTDDYTTPSALLTSVEGVVYATDVFAVVATATLPTAQGTAPGSSSINY